MDFALYQSLSQINMASLENTSDCCLESLAQEGRKNDMVFLVGFCLFRIEILALTSERTQMYWERRSISWCASMLLYKCRYICVQDSIFDAHSISRQIYNRENLGETSGNYPIYRQNLGWLAKSRIPIRLGFSRHMKKGFIRYTGRIWNGRQKLKSPIVWDFSDMWKTGFTFVSSLHSWRNNRPFLGIFFFFFFFFILWHGQVRKNPSTPLKRMPLN